MYGDTEGFKERLRSGKGLLAVAAILLVAGLFMVARIQTAGGITVSDVRFRAPDGTQLSALVYRPTNATPQTPAPGILAVHGYINTRETQSAFAIEFARRGYVVVALDQRGHGYSGGAATAKGFGGPEGLAYLRSLPFVDKDQIGLEGHSMGGWTILAAAAAMPEDYRAMVLEGSSTGAPFAKEGTPTWPRNLALVYSRFDEFAPLMWGVASAPEVDKSAKLMTLFGTAAPVAADRDYGDIAVGTGRILRTPAATHPGDHISTVAVGDAADWFARTLKGGTPRAAGDQIWWIKEAGTGLALLGVAVLSFALVELLLGAAYFAPLRRPAAPAYDPRRWRRAFVLAAFVPAITFYMALMVLPPPIPPFALMPQAVTNWLLVWALVNVALALGIARLLKRAEPARPPLQWPRAALLALIVVGTMYLAVAAAALIPADMRFWVIALRPLDGGQFAAFLAYLAPFTLFIAVTFRGLQAIYARASTARGQALLAGAALSAGFFILTGTQYLFLFATGRLPVAAEALNAIVAIQFVPLLFGLGMFAVFCERRTGSWLPGALIAGPFVTWYMVAGTATHVAI